MNTLVQPLHPMERSATAEEGLLATVRRFANSWDAYRAAGRTRRDNEKADHQFWNAALADPRIMAEIERARSQQAGERRKTRFLRQL